MSADAESGRGTGWALIDGHLVPLAEASLPITDEGASRGDGAFETIGVWGGRPFRLLDHLDRLDRSLRAIVLPASDHEAILREVGQLLEGFTGDAALRVYVTASGTRLVTLADQPVRAAPRVLVPQPAPWIQPLGTYGPAGAKTMSYLPNMAATRAAQAAGGDEALLVSLDGVVLEGPTFCVMWLADGVLCTPALDLGIVDSISRRTLLEIADDEGIETREGRWPLSAAAAATEFLVVSSVRDVIAVERVGDITFPSTAPVRQRLSVALEQRRRRG
jgi:branched-subunit amino acid aminotransferase/4-amino-4-deoxychorismate lyase